MAMHSIYIGQLVWPAVAPLILCMHIHLGGVSIVYYYLHPAWGAYLKRKTVYYFMNHFLVPYIILERIVFDFI